MKKKKHFRFIYIPRTLAIVYICFISLFALDAFSEYTFPKVILALLMHLIPTIILIAALKLSWKYPSLGGLAFILLAVISIAFFHTYSETIAFMIITLPLIIIGILFNVSRKL